MVIVVLSIKFRVETELTTNSEHIEVDFADSKAQYYVKVSRHSILLGSQCFIGCQGFDSYPL